MAKTCRGCVYYRPLSWGEPTLCCHYALDSGKLRDCPVENCEKKLTLEEVMKKLTKGDKQEIIRLRMEQNVPVKTIAEKFHVSKSSIFNIVSEWKQHGDSVFSEEEIINELDERAISEAADDDYVCYEVTGDTDIEAYMSDRKVEEPAPAATEASSKQENVCENIPADIIPENSENVKTEDVLPCAVVDALADKIDMLYDKIAECDRKAQEIQKARANAENGLNELKAFLRKNGYVEIVKMLASNAEWRALQGEK